MSLACIACQASYVGPCLLGGRFLRFTAMYASTLRASQCSAFAFEETRGGAGASQAAPPAAAAPAGKGSSLDFGGTGTSAAPSAGTEVRIPGLGKLGTLPKLDFGLELLYGVNEQSFDDRRLRPEQSDESLGVRGTVRHRF